MEGITRPPDGGVHKKEPVKKEAFDTNVRETSSMGERDVELNEGREK